MTYKISTEKIYKLAASCELPVSGEIMLILKFCHKRDFSLVIFSELKKYKEVALYPEFLIQIRRADRFKNTRVKYNVVGGEISALRNYKTHSTRTARLGVPLFRTCIQKWRDSRKKRDNASLWGERDRNTHENSPSICHNHKVLERLTTELVYASRIKGKRKLLHW